MSALPPKRGEIWEVNFDPTIGAEIKKIRPAVVLSSDAVGKLPLKVIVPITEWKNAFSGNIWHVRLDPDPHNGLIKPSTADALQVRSVDVQRFLSKKGNISATVLDEIVTAVALVIEYQ